MRAARSWLDRTLKCRLQHSSPRLALLCSALPDRLAIARFHGVVVVAVLRTALSHDRTDEIGASIRWYSHSWSVQVAHADGVTRSVYSIGRCVLMLLFWVATFVLLMVAFLAQFSWFPWPDTTLISGEAPRTFFRECAPFSLLHHLLHACMHRGSDRCTEKLRRRQHVPTCFP